MPNELPTVLSQIVVLYPKALSLRLGSAALVDIIPDKFNPM